MLGVEHFSLLIMFAVADQTASSDQIINFIIPYRLRNIV